MSCKGVAAAICAIAAVIGCKDKRVEEPAEVIVEARIEDVLEHPEDFRGKTISFAGEVDDVYSPKVFTLGGSDFFDREILVAVRGASSADPIEADDIVQATGKIHRITIVELERSWDVDLEPEVEMQFSTKPVMMARSLLVTPRAKPGEHELYSSSSTPSEGRRVRSM